MLLPTSDSNLNSLAINPVRSLHTHLAQLTLKFLYDWTDLGLLITKPFVVQKESSSMDLDLQDTINCAAGRTAPAQLIRGSAGKNERICHCIRVTALSISFPLPVQAHSDRLTSWDENPATVIYLSCKEIVQIILIPPRNSKNYS